MTKCPIMKAFTSKGKVVYVYCGQWSCSRCAKMLAKQWGWRVRIHLNERGKPAYFWTFTLPSRIKSARAGFAELPKLFSKIREAMRVSGEKWEYCAFVEGQPHRNNMPHFHIISLRKSPGRIKDFAAKCGFGYMAKETIISSDKAGQYCAKYASKQSPVTPKGFRRVRTSQGWAKLPATPNPEEYIVKSHTEHLWEYLFRVHEQTGVDMSLLRDRWELGPFDPSGGGNVESGEA